MSSYCWATRNEPGPLLPGESLGRFLEAPVAKATEAASGSMMSCPRHSLVCLVPAGCLDQPPLSSFLAREEVEWSSKTAGLPPCWASILHTLISVSPRVRWSPRGLKLAESGLLSPALHHQLQTPPPSPGPLP